MAVANRIKGFFMGLFGIGRGAANAVQIDNFNPMNNIVNIPDNEEIDAMLEEAQQQNDELEQRNDEEIDGEIEAMLEEAQQQNDELEQSNNEALEEAQQLIDEANAAGDYLNYRLNNMFGIPSDEEVEKILAGL